MSVDQLVDAMIEFRPGQKVDGDQWGSVIITSPQNSRTGAEQSISFVCSEKWANDELKEWLRDLLMVLGDDVAETFNLTSTAPNGGGTKSLRARHPDQIFGGVRYPSRRGD